MWKVLTFVKHERAASDCYKANARLCDRYTARRGTTIVFMRCAMQTRCSNHMLPMLVLHNYSWSAEEKWKRARADIWLTVMIWIPTHTKKKQKLKQTKNQQRHCSRAKCQQLHTAVGAPHKWTYVCLWTKQLLRQLQAAWVAKIAALLTSARSAAPAQSNICRLHLSICETLKLLFLLYI